MEWWTTLFVHHVDFIISPKPQSPKLARLKSTNLSTSHFIHEPGHLARLKPTYFQKTNDHSTTCHP